MTFFFCSLPPFNFFSDTINAIAFEKKLKGGQEQKKKH